MLARAALGSIWIYQNYLSPRKGFRCAHSVLHGGTGCSGYAKQAIKQHGTLGAIPHIRIRFQDCKTAHTMLRNAGPDQHRKRRSKSRWLDWCGAGCAPGDCSPGPGKGGDCGLGGCDGCSCT